MFGEKKIESDKGSKSSQRMMGYLNGFEKANFTFLMFMVSLLDQICLPMGYLIETIMENHSGSYFR